MTQVIFILAIANNNVMGCNNSIPWHYSEDIKRFKEVTTGYPIVMGRKTWESLSVQPLPNRPNIVLTRDLNYSTGCRAYKFNNLEDVITNFSVYDKIYVIGGSEIFNAYLSYAHVLDITRINAEHVGDIYWQDIDLNIWELQSSRISGILDFRIYKRKEIICNNT